MGTLLGLLIIGGVLLYCKAKNASPRYGTQEYLDWKYKDYPGGGERMKATEKQAMTCAYGDASLTQSEETSIKKQ